ncbi:activator-dependent family glycosyltransferase [Micromonospora sp. NPDC047793]|uniref:activator-dependent family glycosyltransferase n=1 Tax=unclassified Micromonospora TaxID=2617518 RepID=UPI001033A7A0|nr:activator-dependent family glycosyltransferase [Verrucosispora sp. SN26_14.1]TBL45476.1 activator-dependent family glycosyltransferase [Verrucosispora sp. SN26_14.1]
MRVLFTCNPDRSMFQSMVPLAWALRTAGHEVRVASQPAFADVITQAGLTAVPVGADRNLFRALKGVGVTAEMLEETRVGLPAPYDTAVEQPRSEDFIRMRESYDYRVRHWHRVDNFPMIAGLVAFALDWRPDLVLWEPLTYAGAIAASACGAAHARLLWSIDVFAVARERYLRLAAGRGPDPLAAWLGGYARRYGDEFTEEMAHGHFSIDQLPPALSMRADLPYLSMRYTPYGGAAVVPGWLAAPPTRPRVALTLGITATAQFAGYAASIQDILDALADLDIEVVATVAESEQSRLRAVPANTRVVSYVPLHALVPTCVAVINHAGPGTFLTTARHGVPQLTVPWDFDEPELARRAAVQGGSLTVRADRATGAAVREQLLRLVHEPAFPARARDLATEIESMPTPNQLVPVLTELTATYRATA